VRGFLPDELPDSLLREIFDITELCHISDYGEYGCPVSLEFMRGLRERLFLDVGQDDFHPFVRTTFSETTADATGRARDDCHLVSELLHGSSSFVLM